MVEQLICNQLVGGSIPFSGSAGFGLAEGVFRKAGILSGRKKEAIGASSQVANDNRL